MLAYYLHITQLICFLTINNINASTIPTNKQQRYTKIEGRVINKEGTPVSDVMIYLKKNKALGTITDSAGFFNLNCKKGQQTLIFSHIGHQKFHYTINIKHKELKIQLDDIILNDKINTLDKVLVLGKSPQSVVSSLKSIKQQHLHISGGTSVAVMNPDVQRLETLKDALKLEPGVIIQDLFGANDQPRISIRGSGIQSNPQRRGLYLLQDGIPVNFADGSFIIGVMDPSISESIEVLKGANTLHYGTATLGGALNFNSRTGRYSSGFKIKSEAGLYDYNSIVALMGKKWNKKDGFLSISGSKQNGFRQHNKNRKFAVATNLGYRISNKIDNRTYFNYFYLNFDIPGPLTLNMINKDPSQINKGVNIPIVMGPNILRDKPGREVMVLRIANKTALSLGDSTKLLITAYYQYIKDRFVFPIVLSSQKTYGNDIGGTLSISQNGLNHKLTAGLIGSYGNINRYGHINKNGLDSYRFSKDKLNAVNFTFYLEDYIRLNNHLDLIANLQMVYSERNSKDVFPRPKLRPWYSHSSHKYRYFYSNNTSSNQSYSAFNPRIGAIYNIGKNKDIQFFGNISSSFEPPTFDDLVGTKVTNNINTSPKKLFSVNLEKQTAITAEIGSRYEGTRYGWNVSLYQSWLKNELLEVKDFVLGVKKTKNYPHTEHRGIEFGAMAIPLKGIFSLKGKDQVSIRLMYTYSDFYFSSGVYKKNKLAGVPPHYLGGFLEYKYPNKMFLSFNIESQLKKSPVDHTNTLYQPNYTIYGFRIGFEGWKNISFYLEGKNILNKYYAGSYIINDQIHSPPIPFPKFTAENITFYMPGQTRAFYIGLTYSV